MTKKKRFSRLEQFLRINNNETVAQSIKGIFRFLKYNPNKNQTIDEVMVKYKGIFSIKQYMPVKYA